MGNYLDRFCGGSSSHEELRLHYNGPKARHLIIQQEGPKSSQSPQI